MEYDGTAYAPEKGKEILMRGNILVGRILFALIFIVAGFGHFSDATIRYAAGEGVPYAGLLVPFSGLMAIVGGLMIAIGYRAKVAGWILAAFLVPVTFKMHAFWLVGDPAEAMIQQAMFMKNLSLLGGALAFTYFGSGAYSVDSRVAVDDRTSVGLNTGMAGTVIPTALRRDDELQKVSENAYKSGDDSRFSGLR